MVLSIQLPDDVAAMVAEAAKRGGLSETAFVCEAVLAYFEDARDLAAAQETLARIERGEERTYSLDETEARLGLDD